MLTLSEAQLKISNAGFYPASKVKINSMGATIYVAQKIGINFATSQADLLKEIFQAYPNVKVKVTDCQMSEADPETGVKRKQYNLLVNIEG